MPKTYKTKNVFGLQIKIYHAGGTSHDEINFEMEKSVALDVVNILFS